MVLQAYLELGVKPDDDEEERFRKRGGTAIVTFVSLLAVPNTVLFLVLDRPLTAAVGVAFLVASVALLGYLFATKDGVLFLRATLLIGFLNPILVMWSLGGFAQGGAAILWRYVPRYVPRRPRRSED